MDPPDPVPVVPPVSVPMLPPAPEDPPSREVAPLELHPYATAIQARNSQIESLGAGLRPRRRLESLGAGLGPRLRFVLLGAGLRPRLRSKRRFIASIASPNSIHVRIVSVPCGRPSRNRTIDGALQGFESWPVPLDAQVFRIPQIQIRALRRSKRRRGRAE